MKAFTFHTHKRCWIKYHSFTFSFFIFFFFLLFFNLDLFCNFKRVLVRVHEGWSYWYVYLKVAWYLLLCRCALQFLDTGQADTSTINSVLQIDWKCITSYNYVTQPEARIWDTVMIYYCDSHIPFHAFCGIFVQKVQESNDKFKNYCLDHALDTFLSNYACFIDNKDITRIIQCQLMKIFLLFLRSRVPRSSTFSVTLYNLIGSGGSLNNNHSKELKMQYGHKWPIDYINHHDDKISNI